MTDHLAQRLRDAAEPRQPGHDTMQNRLLREAAEALELAEDVSRNQQAAESVLRDTLESQQQRIKELEGTLDEHHTRIKELEAELFEANQHRVNDAVLEDISRLAAAEAVVGAAREVGRRWPVGRGDFGAAIDGLQSALRAYDAADPNSNDEGWGTPDLDIGKPRSSGPPHNDEGVPM